MKYTAVAVFCGSQPGGDLTFTEHAKKLGNYLGENKIQLIYGGGKKGLMGAVADAAMSNGGKVTGIMPQVLIGWEQQHTGLSDLQVVADMHARKKMMYDLCDAAVVLPGGNGTLDELFEILTWNTLKIHDKKIILLNSNGFYNHLLAHFKQMQECKFLYEKWQERITVCTTAREVIAFLDEGKY